MYIRMCQGFYIIISNGTEYTSSLEREYESEVKLWWSDFLNPI